MQSAIDASKTTEVGIAGTVRVWAERFSRDTFAAKNTVARAVDPRRRRLICWSRT
jgi:hypothetical protein